MLAVEPPLYIPHPKAEKHKTKKPERAQQYAHFRCRFKPVFIPHGHSCLLALIAAMNRDTLLSNLLNLNDENFTCLGGSVE